MTFSEQEDEDTVVVDLKLNAARDASSGSREAFFDLGDVKVENVIVAFQ